MDFGFPLLLHVVFFLFRFLSLQFSILEERWGSGLNGLAAAQQLQVGVLKFLISSGGVLDNACQELAMNGRIVTDTQQYSHG